MNIVVVGCGRVGSELAYSLFKKGHRVAVIDVSPSAFDNLPPDFRGRTVEGEALHQDVLHRAGIEQADALAAVSNNDALNVVVAHLARAVYHLPTVVSRNYDPRRRAIHEAFGLQVVSSASWGAQRIQELLLENGLRTVLSAGNGEVQVCEFTVPAAWQGQAVRDLLPGERCVAVALTRAGRASLPSLDARLEAGDVLHIGGTPDGMGELRKRLGQVPQTPRPVGAPLVGQATAPIAAGAGRPVPASDEEA